MSEIITAPSQPAEALAKSTSAVPEGYKIVKVRKPDGTIVKVRRPIAKVATSSVASPPGDVEKKSNSQSPASDQHQAAVKVETTPKNTVLKSSGSNSSKSGAEKLSTTPPVHASKLETSAKSYRLFRRIHRVHKHASRLVSAFDPYSDTGDLQDGDEYIESDNDSDGSKSEDSGDEDHNNRDKQSTTTVSNEGKATRDHGHVAIGNGVAPRKAQPATKPSNTPSKTKVDVREVQTEKLSSIETDPVTREKVLSDVKDLEAADAQPVPPRTLHGRSVDWTTLIVWALVILLPLVFIALAIATACLHNKRADRYDGYGLAMAHATKFGITAWPIVFAGILAQTLKACATYKVERGIRLVTLEQLVTSHSVASALKQPFVLRRINWVTIGLLALWALSPLGSQAMQYTTNTRLDVQTDNATVYYLNTVQENLALEQVYISDKTEATNIENSFSDSMTVLYAAVFQPQSEYQPIGSDPWGNPLVPIYEKLVGSNQQQGWIDVKLSPNIDYDTNDFYSSYYGIPIAQFDDYDGNWTFTMHSSYLYFEALFLNTSTTAQLADIDVDPLDSDRYYQTLNGSLSMNMWPPTNTSTGNVTFFSQCSMELGPDDDATWAYAVLNFTQTFVDSLVTCTGSNCTVTSVNKVSGDVTNMYDFMDEFIKASNTGLDDYDLGDTIHSVTEMYVSEPSNVTQPGAGAYCDISKVDLADFTKRMSYLMNTFYSTGFTHDFAGGSIKPNESVTLFWANGTEHEASMTLPADGIHQYIDIYDYSTPFIYVINWRWLSVFAICSGVLLLVGIAGVLLEMHTIRSDVLSFASSLARHSKYIKLPPSDETISGAEKARRLGDTRVIMQDARPSAEVGKIVLGTDSEGVQRLRLGRQYH